MRRRLFKALALLAGLALTAACQSGATTPTEALSLQSGAAALRAAQSRNVEVANETELLTAVSLTLQDFGFKIDESQLDSGIISGSKVQGSGVFGNLPYDVRVSVSSRMVSEGLAIVRANFQKIRHAQLVQFTRAEPIDDPTIYTRFFDALEQSLFLERNEA